MQKEHSTQTMKKASTKDLIVGILGVMAGIILILLFYGILLGTFQSLGAGEYVTLKDPNGLIAVMFLVFLLGSFGGLELGRYFESQYAGKRVHVWVEEERQTPPPP